MSFFGVIRASGGGGGGSINPGGTGSGNPNSIARWYGVGSNTLQGSSVYLDDSNNITGVNSLTVTTLIATTTITTGDNIIMLNDQVVGAPSTNAGIEVERGTSTNSQLLWIETDGRWEGGIAGSLKKFLQNGDNVSELANNAGYLTSFTETDPLSLHLNGLNWTASAPLSYSGTTLSIPQASGTQAGYLSSTDWTTFNSKGNGTVTAVSGTAPVISSGGAAPAISMHVADVSHDGYLSSMDWNAFNSGGVLNEQYTKVSLANGADWNITHSADANFKRTVQIWKNLTSADTSWNFDTSSEAAYIQEDATKTDFSSNRLQLQSSTIPLACYAHWSVNESSGTNVPDSSGNSRNGTTSGGPTWVAGKLNNCLRFDGTDDHVDFGAIASFERTQTCSYECWFKTTSLSTEIMNKYDAGTVRGMDLYLDNNGLICFVLANSASNYLFARTTTGGFNNGAWHHLVVTYDGSSTVAGVIIYVDNVIKTLTAIHDNLSATTITANNFMLGEARNVSHFNGDLDEIVVYSTTISASDVTARWNGGIGIENIVAYDTSQGWYVTTGTNSINTATWIAINIMTLTQSTPTSTQLRYLMSIDSRSTWKYWTGSAWATETLANLHTNGNTITDLQALTKTEWDLLFSAGTLDMAFGLKTTDNQQTPYIDLISINYDIPGTQKCTDSEVILYCVNSTTTKVSNVSGGTLYYLRANIDL